MRREDESDTIVEGRDASEESAPPSLAPVRMNGAAARSTPTWVVIILVVAIIGSVVIAFSSGILLYKFTQRGAEIEEQQSDLNALREESEKRSKKLGLVINELRTCSHDVSSLVAISEHNAALSEEHRPAIEALITGENEDITSLRRKLKNLNEAIEDRIDSMGNPRRKSREYWKSLARKVRNKELLTSTLRKKEAEYFLKAEQIKSTIDRDSKSPDAELLSRNKAREALIDKLAESSSL